MAKKVTSSELFTVLSKNKNIQNKMRQMAEVKLEKNKNILIQDFQKHPVSQEISSGPGAQNMSGTLGGYGNLFSFIGFNSGSDPVKQWVELLKSKIKIINASPKTKINGDNITYSFQANTIGKADLDSAKMPWEGRSWITAIERGISGFSFYVSKAIGRSGGGIQSNHNVRGGKYSPVSYWSGMWSKFIKNLNV